MSKKANPTVIGAFTFGALAILVAAILILGSSRFMQQAMPCVMYFEGSVAGLDVGAPVLFRGVKVGAVKEIRLVYDKERNEFLIPVIVEFYRNSASQATGEPMAETHSLEGLVARGARAQLASQSLLTGKQNICLDFHQDKPARLVPDKTGLPQIPTLPTTLQAFSSKLEALPLDEIVRDLRKAMQGLSELVNAESTRSVTTNLNAALVSTRDLMQSLNAEFLPIAKSLSEIADTAKTSLDSVTVTLQQIQRSMDSESPLRYEVGELLDSTKTAVRGIAELTDALERAPESIVKGKTHNERYEE